MKKYLILSLLILTGFTRAQDQLFKRDNSKLLVKVTEISPLEIKYKQYDNLEGPIYIVDKREVILIIYENGKHEVIDKEPVSLRRAEDVNFRNEELKKASSDNAHKEDSSKYFAYSNSLSLNFLALANMEVAVIYKKDFFKDNLNITIPLAIGVDNAAVTESVYFNTGYQNYGEKLRLNRKLIEVGFGVYYYPTLNHAVNYYVGPSVSYMEYGITQEYSYRDPVMVSNTYTYHKIAKKGTISRYCVSITNGLIFRTKSRISFNIFGSLGFKNDVSSTKITDPITNLEIKAVKDPVGIYIWMGATLGLSF